VFAAQGQPARRLAAPEVGAPRSEHGSAPREPVGRRRRATGHEQRRRRCEPEALSLYG